MTLFDTHCHLTDEAFAEDVEETIARAEAGGVQHIVQACIDADDFGRIITLSARHPGLLLPTIGIHPENMADDIHRQLSDMQCILEQHREQIYAIGEVGLDLHWDTSRLKEQQELLREQVRWSIRYGLPLLLHVRDAMDELLAMLPELASEADTLGVRLRGIMHCYAGTAEQAYEMLRYGDFYFGVGGTLTYKKSLVPDVARAIGIGKIVLETDAPYLAPVPHRGHRNEPAYVANTAAALAVALQIPIDEVTRITTENAHKLFGKR